MFQKGTGERFKYKEAVKKMKPSATCSRHTYDMTSPAIVGYRVQSATELLSSFKPSAEAAWADAYTRLQVPQND